MFLNFPNLLVESATYQFSRNNRVELIGQSTRSLNRSSPASKLHANKREQAKYSTSTHHFVKERDYNAVDCIPPNSDTIRVSY